MTDIRLDDADGSFVTVDSRVLKSTASDFLWRIQRGVRRIPVPS